MCLFASILGVKRIRLEDILSYYSKAFNVNKVSKQLAKLGTKT